MAKWRIRETREGHLALDYLRPGTPGIFRCGLLQRWTDLRLLLAWVLEQEAAAAGDLVLLPDGATLQIFAPPEEQV
jgi:hypothetical protein